MVSLFDITDVLCILLFAYFVLRTSNNPLAFLTLLANGVCNARCLNNKPLPLYQNDLALSIFGFQFHLLNLNTLYISIGY